MQNFEIISSWEKGNEPRKKRERRRTKWYSCLLGSLLPICARLTVSLGIPIFWWLEPPAKFQNPSYLLLGGKKRGQKREMRGITPLISATTSCIIIATWPEWQSLNKMHFLWKLMLICLNIPSLPYWIPLVMLFCFAHHYSYWEGKYIFLKK